VVGELKTGRIDTEDTENTEEMDEEMVETRSGTPSLPGSVAFVSSVFNT
jgi:hypothetical protein